MKNVNFVLPHKLHIHCPIINKYIIDNIIYKRVLEGTFIQYHVNIMTKSGSYADFLKGGVTFVTTHKPLVHACSCFLLSFTRHISERWSKFVLLQKDFWGGEGWGGCFVSSPDRFQSKHYLATFKSGHSQVW